MKRRATLLVVLAVILIAAILWVWSSRGSRERPLPAAGRTDPGAAERPLVVDLYFPDAAGGLTPERRELADPVEPEAQIRSLVAEILRGPSQEGLTPPLPEGIEVAAVHLNDTGIAFVDLSSPDKAPPPSSGSLGEMLAVYSLVDSILLNIPEVRAVTLLWNGRQQSSFAGHLDTSRPLTANTDLLRRRSSSASSD